jgi:hypothetical protein
MAARNSLRVKFVAFLGWSMRTPSEVTPSTARFDFFRFEAVFLANFFVMSELSGKTDWQCNSNF